MASLAILNVTDSSKKLRVRRPRRDTITIEPNQVEIVTEEELKTTEEGQLILEGRSEYFVVVIRRQAIRRVEDE
jgi:hypothetical protein